ncbi:unnamed protein product [Zymoseptoria tritici ST99CH_3D7]|uniref:FAD/NAD(P)-binding domain-containing protein n=1 Tax=Zymoseptoria tritici (strain ST99CH_3D7) TaxID=1276538 RepID=A0A1X7S9I3_ZYMT9|nr:unnamed protein product [Zymoseptoria tritici ST99CH_3D7]
MPSAIRSPSPVRYYSVQTKHLNVHVSQTRSASTSNHPPSSHPSYEALVVGAGPAGITAVGNLLEQQIQPILWVDGAFNGGRINRAYREVPSNTKVKLFVDFAEATAPFRDIVGGKSQPEVLKAIRELDQEKGCDLGRAGDICSMLTEGLVRTPGVAAEKGNVREAILNSGEGGWSVAIAAEKSQPATTVQTKRVILCTGSHPSEPTLPVDLPVQHIELDDALSPTKLSALLAALGPTTIGVVGASHSAVLVLMNLTRLALSSKPDLHIKWFTRHPLRYAEYEADFIARDNTGLKGEAAAWARENLEPETMPNSPVKNVITKVAYEKGAEKETYEKEMKDCSHVVQAVGYTRNPLPTLKDGKTGREIQVVFDHDRGVFKFAGGKEVVPGLGGAGIAFPERVVDRKYGHEEFNVGFFKFMKAVRRWVVEEWK